MPQSRRYHYSPHDGSPHFGMLNVLIGFAVMMCLWNVWTAPPPTSATATTSTSGSTMRNYSTTFTEQSQTGKDQQQEEQEQQDSKRLQLVGVIQPHSTKQTQISAPAGKIPNDIRLFPVHTAGNGQKFILLTSDQRQETRSQTLVSTNKLRKEEEILKQLTPRKTHTQKKLVPANRRSLSTPLFVDTVTYERLPSSSFATYPRHHYRPNWSSWLYGIAVSGSILTGGLLAIRALKRMDRWEQLSKEDSLAFDVAYTSTYNDDVESYGSFVSSEWSVNRLDRFDV